MNYQTSDDHIQAVLDFLQDAITSPNADLETLSLEIYHESPAETLSLLVFLVAGHLSGKRDLVEYLQPYLDDVRSRRV